MKNSDKFANKLFNSGLSQEYKVRHGETYGVDWDLSQSRFDDRQKRFPILLNQEHCVLHIVTDLETLNFSFANIILSIRALIA